MVLKAKVEADSCSTANIIDEERFKLLQNALEKKLTLYRHVQLVPTEVVRLWPRQAYYVGG